MKNKLEIIALQIDLARQKETMEYIKSHIDFAKENGYNAVFVYLEAAVRVDCVSYFSEDHTYSVEEIKEIVAYGNEKGIDIIPALENLAHMENFMRYPQLAFMSECQDAEVDGRGIRTGLGDCACVSNPKAMEFLDTYYSQVIPLFTSQYVHAGLDEPFDFAVCDKCMERVRNGESKQELFFEHVMRTYKLVKSFGKTMMMWDDFFAYLDIAPRLPRDIIMCTWCYSYVQDEVPGHWVGRLKRDWFKYYDALGFRYMFCTAADYSSKLFNIETYTNYASKNRPMGALMTMWERAHRFYYSGYPSVIYAGKLWNGKITEADKLKVYAEILGSEELADIILNLDVKVYSFQPNNLQICENSTLARYGATNVAEYAVARLKKIFDGMEEGLQKDILLDIYTTTLDEYLGMLQQRIALEVFDNYETRAKKPAYFIKKIQEMKEMSQEAYVLNQKLWEKCRPGIKSWRNQFANKYEGRAKRYDDMIAYLEKNEKHGVFYADLMLYCVYGTPRIIVEINYKDKSIPATVHRSGAKVGDGVNTIRFAMENKPIDNVVFTLYGEGALYPVNFRYTYGGKKYVVSSVTKLAGETRDLKKILTGDTRCAQMGNDDAQAHFEDLSVSKTQHKIKLKFKRLK